MLKFILSFFLLATSPGTTQINKNSKVVVLSFDDGFYSVYKYAYPLLKSYKFKITLGLISSKIGKKSQDKNRTPYSYLSEDEIKELLDSLNIELASHSVSHRPLTELDESSLVYEIFESKRIIDSIFGVNVVTFVYPYGRYDERIIRLVASAGYKIGRSVRFGVPDFFLDPYIIPIKEVRNTVSVKEIISEINDKDVVVLLFHRIVPKPKYFTDYSLGNFERLLAWLKENNIQVLTLKEVYYKWWQDFIEKYIVRRPLFQKIDVDQTGTLYSR